MQTNNKFVLGQEVGNSHTYVQALTLQKAIERGYKNFLTGGYITNVKEFPEDFLPDSLVLRRYYENHENQEVLYDLGDGLIYLIIPFSDYQNTTIEIWGSTKAVTDELMAKVIAQFPKAPPAEDEDGAVDLTFWMGTPHGPKRVTRQIDVPKWADIVGNYTSPVAAELSDMMVNFKPSYGGQLILWHGQPGTGKTYALRTLADAWRKWCDVQYVVDPERFFNDADYLMNVVLENAGYVTIPGLDDDDEDKTEEKWRLLLFEDTGELMAANAGERTGQGLARLLNIVDGLIGQGLKIMLLITTNEELQSLHPAVARSGRASNVIKFEYLSGPESVAWGQEHGITIENKPHPVSDLYAALEGFRKSEESGKVKQSIGFGRR